MAGSGYTVQPGVLTAGSGQVCGLRGECGQIAGSVTEAFSALAAAAGDAGVESAARSAGVSALRQFLNANAGYQHTARELPDTATTYADAALNPRFFGMTQAGTGLRVLVCELLTGRPSGPGERAEFGTMLSCTLLTPAWAAKVLAAWARAAGGFRTGEPPVIDIFARDPGGRLARDRYEVRRDGGFFGVRRPATALPPERLDEMQVTQLLTAALIGAAG